MELWSMFAAGWNEKKISSLSLSLSPSLFFFTSLSLLRPPPPPPFLPLLWRMNKWMAGCLKWHSISISNELALSPPLPFLLSVACWTWNILPLASTNTHISGVKFTSNAMNTLLGPCEPLLDTFLVQCLMWTLTHYELQLSHRNLCVWSLDGVSQLLDSSSWTGNENLCPPEGKSLRWWLHWVTDISRNWWTHKCHLCIRCIKTSS